MTMYQRHSMDAVLVNLQTSLLNNGLISAQSKAMADAFKLFSKRMKGVNVKVSHRGGFYTIQVKQPIRGLSPLKRFW